MEIVKTYRQSIPATRFIGKKYGDEDRVNGGFGQQWGEWFQNGWFDVLEEAAGGAEALRALYEDGGATVGLMRWKEGEPFQYWIGMFLPAGTPAPDGYGFVDFPAADLGICWFHGRENEIYGKEHLCAAPLQEMGMEIVTDEQGAWWFFERYACPRFTTPDENGAVILDIGHYVK